MQITPILICLVLISIVQATLFARISKPKPRFNMVHTHNFKNSEITRRISPEERRKQSLFPKSYVKYVISSEPLYKIATQKPILRGTRKPLMKKLIVQDKFYTVKDSDEIKQPNTGLLYDNNLAVNPKAKPVVISEEVSIEIVEENSEESDEIQNDNIEKINNLENNNIESKTDITNTTHKDVFYLKDIILPPKIKPVEVAPKIIIEEPFADVSDTVTTSKQYEIPDTEEFIFIDPVQKPTERDKINSEEVEEYVTEIYEEPIFRKKRASNVIEEENLASTVAGYKYTWKDERINNDLAFKNINT